MKSLKVDRICNLCGVSSQMYPLIALQRGWCCRPCAWLIAIILTEDSDEIERSLCEYGPLTADMRKVLQGGRRKAREFLVLVEESFDESHADMIWEMYQCLRVFGQPDMGFEEPWVEEKFAA